MGWINEDAPDHEGYVAAFVDGGRGRARELGYPEDNTDHKTLPVGVVAAACTCGWRSKRFAAPAGTAWIPYTVILHEPSETQLVGLWSDHVKAELQPRGRLRADMLPYAGELL